MQDFEKNEIKYWSILTDESHISHGMVVKQNAEAIEKINDAIICYFDRAINVSHTVEAIFAIRNPQLLLQTLDLLLFEEAVNICKKHEDDIKGLIWFDPEGDRAVQSALETLCFYFFATCDEEIMTSIVNRIYTAGGLNGVRVFADRCPKNIPYAGMTREKVLAAVYTAIYTKKDELVEAVEMESNTQKQRQLYDFLSDCGIVKKRRSL